MATRNLKDNSKKPWLCECYPQGREGKRIRKRFSTKGEAITFERFTIREIEDKPWLGQKEDNRRLTDLIKYWKHAHGMTLSNGEKIYSLLILIAEAMNNPIASRLTSKHFSDFRKKRLSGEISFIEDKRNRGTASIATCNLDLAYLHSVFNKLIELGEWHSPNPLKDIKPFRKKDNVMSFLTKEQITILLDSLATGQNPDIIKIVKLCLSTGARWNEAAQLKGSQLSKYKVTFTKTKSGKNRSVPISKELYDEIYQSTAGALFSPCYYAFLYRLKTMDFNLPSGQASHVLRHSFASHFMMNGGNILVLKEILGHSDITMTMRYAHFSPDHLSEALTKNPLFSL
ncbi:tyrosine-type recombinase/integrase [Photobacterium sp. S4TG1]|uniref:phage integrase n=1 Tax=Photobacterium sp. S4TG1 TaxID=3114587 RepID=UPI002E19C259|nr:tyrosine-type recombinase/integrase [Photobacterium sp. S4TG1]